MGFRKREMPQCRAKDF